MSDLVWRPSMFAPIVVHITREVQPHRCDTDGSWIPQGDGTAKGFCSKCGAHTDTEKVEK